jgi:hypothetical protein
MTIFITVVSRSPEQVPAYFYGGTEIAQQGEVEDGTSRGAWFILTAPDQLAGEYQAGRLNSGLHASKVHDSLAAAQEFLLDVFGVTA